MSKKTLFLHVGTGKTGTSALQLFFSNNREKLKGCNLDYPDFDLSEWDHVFNKYREHINGRFLMKGFFEGSFYESKSILEEAVESSKCDKILISEEAITTRIVLGKDLHKFFDIFSSLKFNTKIIIYLRDPVDYVSSMWGQKIKDNLDERYLLSLDQSLGALSSSPLMEDSVTIYKSVYLFSDFFGKDNVVVRPYEFSKMKNGNVIEDFLSILDINDFSVDGGKDNYSNVSFDRGTMEKLILLRRNFKDTPELNFAIHELSNISSGQKISGTLSDKNIKDIEGQFQDVIVGISKLFLNEKWMFNKRYFGGKKDQMGAYKKLSKKEEMEFVSLAKEKYSLIWLRSRSWWGQIRFFFFKKFRI